MKRFYALFILLNAYCALQAHPFHKLFEEIDNLMHESWQEFDRSSSDMPVTTIQEDDNTITISVRFEHLADDTVNAEFDSQRQEATINVDGYHLTIANNEHTHYTTIRYNYRHHSNTQEQDRHMQVFNETTQAHILPAEVILQSADDIAVELDNNIVTIHLAKKEKPKNWPKQKINVIKSTTRS